MESSSTTEPREIHSAGFHRSLYSYPASTYLQLRVYQIVCAIALGIFSVVSGLDGANWGVALVGIFTALVTILAAGVSIHSNPVMLATRHMVNRASSVNTVNVNAGTIPSINFQMTQSCSSRAPVNSFRIEYHKHATIFKYVEIVAWCIVIMLCTIISILCISALVSSSALKPAPSFNSVSTTQVAVASINMVLSLSISVSAIMMTYFQYCSGRKSVQLSHF